MAMTMFDSWFNHMQNVLYRGVSSPRATDLRVVLCNGAIAKNSTMLEVMRQLVEPNPSYEDATYQPTVDATFDQVQNRSETAPVTLTFTAQVNPIVFNTVVLMADRGHSNVLGVRKRGSRTVQTIDATANKLMFEPTVPLDLPNNTPVVVAPLAGGVVPAQLLASGNPQILHAYSQVDSAAEKSIQLVTPGSYTPIDFNLGTSPIRVINADGKLVAFETFPTRTIEAGRSISIVVNINLGGAQADVEAA
jgi:hypothetical protein